MTGVTNTSTKRKLRLENKKKKLAALIDIAKLNEYDRQKSKSTKNMSAAIAESEPSCKKLKTDESQVVGQPEDPPPLIGEVGPSGKPLLQGADLLELKKMLREKTKQIRALPTFKLREMGENASLKVDMENRCPLFLSDLQHLIMYSQIGPHSPYSPARWCALDKYTKLEHTILLIIENVSLYHYMSHESQFPFLSSRFENKLEIITPTSYKSDIVRDLSMVPLTGSQMKRFINCFGSLEAAVHKSAEVFDTVKNFFPIDDSSEINSESSNDLPASDKFSRTQLLLSGWQMIEENFPLPIKGLMERKYSGYVLTKDRYREATSSSPMFAIDCEMCKTTSGDLELTRVSAVNEKHQVFYDTLVKPDNKIVDYLTKWSGIKPKMMKHVTKKLRDVQEELRNLLPDNAILIGQSLCNDLHALKMMHPYVIDTSVIFNITGDRIRKTKLQTLAREFLSVKIQTGTQGHCSSEDSLACMKLTQLKLRKHIHYGDAVMNAIYSETRAYPELGTSSFATSMLKQCTKIDKKACVVAVDDIGSKYKFYVDKNSTASDKNIECVSVKSNKDVIKRACEGMNKCSLSIAHIRVASNQLESNSGKVCKTLDKWVKEVFDAVPSPSFVGVLLGGQKDGANGLCFLQLV